MGWEKEAYKDPRREDSRIFYQDLLSPRGVGTDHEERPVSLLQIWG